MAIIESSLATMLANACVGAAVLLLAVTSESLDDSQRLIGVCASGGIAGAILGVAVFPRSTLKLTAVKFFGSSLASALFSPAICRYFSIEADMNYTLATSGVVGLVAWGVILLVVPAFTNGSTGLAKKIFPGLFPSDDVCNLQTDENEDGGDEGPQGSNGSNLQRPPFRDKAQRKSR